MPMEMRLMTMLPPTTVAIKWLNARFDFFPIIGFKYPSVYLSRCDNLNKRIEYFI